MARIGRVRSLRKIIDLSRTVAADLKASANGGVGRNPNFANLADQLVLVIFTLGGEIDP